VVVPEEGFDFGVPEGAVGGAYSEGAGGW